MVAKEEQQTPHLLAKAALEHLQQQKVMPTPAAYAVFYHYEAKSHPEMVTEIDGYFKEKRPFTAEFVNYLYQRYITENYDKNTLDEVSRQVHLLMQQLLHAIDNIGDDASGFHTTLEQFSSVANVAMKDDRLKTMVSKVLDKTAKLQQKSSLLDRKLKASSKEISHLKRDLEKISLKAEMDFLTGVHNRLALEQYLRQLRETVPNQDWSMLMIDIDYFKHFNDKFGHQVGDEVLRQVAKTLVDLVRGRDFVARYGGEEFVIILPETQLAGALVVAEKIRHEVANRQLRVKQDHKLLPRITVSIGVAQWQSPEEFDKALKRADDALYKSKQGGRNKVTRQSLN